MRRPRPKGRHVPGVMNRTESAYGKVLARLKGTGEILDYWFESVKLKIGEKCFYTPDFLVMLPDGTLEIHEVKGRMMDDAQVKLRAVRDKFPFPITVCRLIRGEWQYEVRA